MKDDRMYIGHISDAIEKISGYIGNADYNSFASNDMQIDWNSVVFNMLTIKGIYGREMYESWYKMAVMIQSGLDLSPVITHEFDIDDFQQGFDAMLTGQSGKVILNWEA